MPNTILKLAKRYAPPSLKRFIRTLIDPSQNGEVTVLKELVSRFVCERVLIDVGANDGVTMSNSLPFVKNGWRAILLEPAPKVYLRLKQHHASRNNVTCLQLACLDRTDEAELYYGSDGDEGFMSTLSRVDNEWFDQHRSSTSVRVKTDTLTNVMITHAIPSCPGLLLVDCEGMDYETLLGLDFSRFRPTIIVTEEYEWEPDKHAAKYGLLIRHQYTLVQKVGCNTVWLDRLARRR